MNLNERCTEIHKLFQELANTDSRIIKESLVNKFRSVHLSEPSLLDDLDFCFEVLAGKHKLGYTLYCTRRYIEGLHTDITIRGLGELLKGTKSMTKTMEVAIVCSILPEESRSFLVNLFNREIKVGYSNLVQMRTNKSPMLAKKYPETFRANYSYYVQEKLDGNRCIAYFDYDAKEWKYVARSGKPLKLSFEMSWADTDTIFDGEVMTLSHAGSRDFNKTNGVINSKYGDKSGLHYFIYDIIDANRTYEERKTELDEYAQCDLSNTGCTILPVLDKITLNANIDYNWQLDEWLDKIVDQGGEGLILRDPNGYYEHKRSNSLLKYKKVKTMDLRIIGVNEGQGKYEGLIGSFICENDEHTILVNVAGMSDYIRQCNPSIFLDKIIEVAYFDITKGKDSNTYSLRFPRFKHFRADKIDTSIY